MKFSEAIYKKIFDDFKGINLTSIKDFEQFEILQIEDSLAPIKYSKIFNNIIKERKTILDVGFGGGFPILPLAQELKNLNFVGIDSKRKKVEVVKTIANDLNIFNVKLYHERIENILIDKEIAIVIKAVGDIKDILDKIKTNKSIMVFFYKGPNLEKKENYKKCLSHWTEVEKSTFEIHGNARTLIAFKNINVPHGTITGLSLKKFTEL